MPRSPASTTPATGWSSRQRPGREPGSCARTRRLDSSRSGASAQRRLERAAEAEFRKTKDFTRTGATLQLSHRGRSRSRQSGHPRGWPTTDTSHFTQNKGDAVFVPAATARGSGPADPRDTGRRPHRAAEHRRLLHRYLRDPRLARLHRGRTLPVRRTSASATTRAAIPDVDGDHTFQRFSPAVGMTCRRGLYADALLLPTARDFACPPPRNSRVPPQAPLQSPQRVHGRSRV